MTGDTITVTWGEEHYQVTQYNGFRLGPFTVTVTVQPGETDEAAWARANTLLDKHVETMFIAKRNGYAERWANRG
jgi:hypothetical protein